MNTLTKASLYFVSLQVDFVMVQDMRAARESEKVGNRSNEKGQGHHISTPRKRIAPTDLSNAEQAIDNGYTVPWGPYEGAKSNIFFTRLYAGFVSGKHDVAISSSFVLIPATRIHILRGTKYRLA